MDDFERCEAADADVRTGPHAWIQWKGTNVCMDIRCSCGVLSHVDADFAYYVTCGACGKTWVMCATIKMLPAEKAPERSVTSHVSSDM